MIKRNAAKPVRVAPPMMEEQEVSTSTLQELLEKEETVSNLIFSKGREEGISKSYKSFKNCTFRNQTFSECKFRSSQLAACCRKADSLNQRLRFRLWRRLCFFRL